MLLDPAKLGRPGVKGRIGKIIFSRIFDFFDYFSQILIFGVCPPVRPGSKKISKMVADTQEYTSVYFADFEKAPAARSVCINVDLQFEKMIS